MSRFMKKFWLLSIIIVFVAFGLGKQFFAPSESTNKTFIVQKQNLKKTLTLAGKIDAKEKVTLRFQTSGILLWLGVQEGDTVRKYQTIARLDTRSVRKNLDKQLNFYMKTRWDFEQTKDDYEGSIVTDKIKRILEKSQFDLNNSVLDVELQHLAVDFSKLTTPIAGIVTKVMPNVSGINITPTNAEIEVINPASLYLSVSADQTEVIQLQDHAKATIVFDAFPDSVIEGSIDRISYAPTEETAGTVYSMWITFPLPSDQNKSYRLGMTADVEFILEQKPDVLAVPESAILRENSKTYVLKNHLGKTQKIEVTLGKEFDGMQEVLSGLSEGDVIHD